MLELIKNKNGHDFDRLSIKTDEGIFYISVEGTLDLYWTYIPNKSILETPNSYTFTITKENYLIYEEFLKLYNNIREKKPYYNISYETKIKDEKVDDNGLFIDNTIKWHSDEFIYEYASILTIEKLQDTFNVTFEKSKEHNENFYMTYAIRIRNSGSRYYPYNIPFMNMYHNLKQYEPDCHQIHIEEYIYKNKILCKK